jgi:hypothetical protein
VSRDELAAARARGKGFPRAWRRALANLEAAALPPAKYGKGREAAEWMAALGATRSAWKRSYNRKPATAGELAASELAEALADTREVPEERLVRGA